MFDGFAGASDASTSVFEAPVNQAFSLDLELFVNSTVLWGTNGSPANLFASVGTSFQDTISFPFAGPIFTLPDGYTANSLSGLIVDNQWTGGGRSAGVPEPSVLLLLGSGLAVLMLWRRKWAA